jgi:NhaP-type Na+/H+ or K+/H+ antiporter
MVPSAGTALILAAITALEIGAQWLSWWLKLPAILFLLLIGLVAGPVTGVLDPDRLFGDLLLSLVSLGVAIILFEGALTLRLHEIRGSRMPRPGQSIRAAFPQMPAPYAYGGSRSRLP